MLEGVRLSLRTDGGLSRGGGGWGLGEGCAWEVLSGERLADAPGGGSQPGAGA